MSKSKAKNDLPSSNDNRGGFIWVWVISHIAFWMAMYLPYSLREQYRYYGFNPRDSTSPGLILFTTLMMSLLQWRVTQRVLNQSMRGWVLASLIGALLSIVAFNAPQITGVYPSVLALLLPIAFVQTAWLSRYVKAAWLWFVASGVGALFFAFPLSDHDYNKGSLALVPWIIGLAISQGIIQAVVMRHLWTRSRETEKAKQQPAAEDTDDQSILQRLALNDANSQVIDETPLAQQQSR